MTVSHKESHERIIKLNGSGGSCVEIKACGQICFQGESLHSVTTVLHMKI